METNKFEEKLYSLKDLGDIACAVLNLYDESEENDCSDKYEAIKDIVKDEEQYNQLIEHISIVCGLTYQCNRSGYIQKVITIVSDEIDIRDLSKDFIDNMDITIKTLKAIKEIVEKEDK